MKWKFKPCKSAKHAANLLFSLWSLTVNWISLGFGLLVGPNELFHTSPWALRTCHWHSDQIINLSSEKSATDVRKTRRQSLILAVALSLCPSFFISANSGYCLVAGLDTLLIIRPERSFVCSAPCFFRVTFSHIQPVLQSVGYKNPLFE